MHRELIVLLVFGAWGGGGGHQRLSRGRLLIRKKSFSRRSVSVPYRIQQCPSSILGQLVLYGTHVAKTELYSVVMARISKRRRNEASILASFSISKRNEPTYSRTCKDRSEANPAYSTP
jgi:hypothetical protein